MSGIFLALLFLMDDAAIRRTIDAFNHTWERASVLTAGAKITDFSAGWATGESQMYFEVTAVHVSPNGTAVAEAAGNRYGSLILKQTVRVVFRLKREGAVWKIDSLRLQM